MTPPLRVLFVDEGVLGHRTMTAQLREALAAHPDLTPVFATVPPPNRFERLLLRRLRPLGDWDLFELRWRLRWSWRTRRLVKRHLASVDVAHVTTVASALLMRGPMRRLPCALAVDATVRQFRALEYKQSHRQSALQRWLLARLERRAIANAAAIVAFTEWNTVALRRENEVSNLRVETIHPGVDADWWAAAVGQRPTRSDGPLRVLFVGNDVERKGLQWLVKAVERLDAPTTVDVVSDDPVSETETVRVHRGVKAGTQTLRELYANADVLALPTRADAVPWVVLEAMAAGLPVVASDVGGISELLDNAGELIAPGNVNGLTSALQRLADPALRRQLAERGLRRVRERYDTAVQVPRLLELLREIAGRPRGSAGTARRVRRRTVLAVGLGTAGVAMAAPYLILLPDDEFERLVASHLGIEPELAKQLLQRPREDYGEARYDAHATAFALAVRGPVGVVLPDEIRERAIRGLVEPMLSAPASNLAYGVTGLDPGGPAPCSGLVRGQ